MLNFTSPFCVSKDKPMTLKFSIAVLFVFSGCLRLCDSALCLFLEICLIVLIYIYFGKPTASITLFVFGAPI